MPININALGDSAPEPQPEAEEPKRKRRTKAELIEAAVIPGDDEQVELKDVGTGAKIPRPWLVALEKVRDGKAEWADKSMKYAMLKWDQQREREEHDALNSPDAPAASGQDQFPVDEKSRIEDEIQDSVPPMAHLGDEVSIGSDTFVVGHGNVLTNGPVAVDGEIVKPKRRWRRELGSGVNGPWESVDVPHPPAQEKHESTDNGHGDVSSVVERQPMRVEDVGLGEWRVGTGILEKIGLPDYSQLQVGPVSASRTVVDDGRRTTVQIGDRTAEIPTAVVEAYQQVSDSVEYVLRYQRGELISFLESTGALKQAVS